VAVLPLFLLEVSDRLLPFSFKASFNAENEKEGGTKPKGISP
jgi:hypothetical protein